jgi:lysylphosphatidylglycerol synthetase-like protein (DUF2156 family)
MQNVWDGGASLGPPAETVRVPRPGLTDSQRLASESFGCYGHNRAVRRFLGPGGRSWIAYRIAGPMVVALGDPAGVQSEWPGLRESFERWAAPRSVIWYGAATPLPGRRSWLMGQAAIVWTDRFGLAGGPMANLRHSVTAARRRALPIVHGPWSSLAASLRSELSEIDVEWRKDHRVRLGFSLSDFEDATVDERSWLVVSSQARVEAFVTWLPTTDQQGLVLDLMRRRRDAMPGAVEQALVEGIAAARQRGVEWVSLGMSADPRSRLVSRFNPPSLRAFKQKFQPDWQDRYLLFSDGRAQRLAAMAAVAYLHIQKGIPRILDLPQRHRLAV